MRRRGSQGQLLETLSEFPEATAAGSRQEVKNNHTLLLSRNDPIQTLVNSLCPFAPWAATTAAVREPTENRTREQ